MRKVVYYITFLMLGIALIMVLMVAHRFKVTIVVTDSMEPAILVNSISIIDKCDIEDLKVGDIIMYKSNAGFQVTHRVIRVRNIEGKTTVITKGDNNPNRDIYPVDDEMLIGKIIYTNNNIAKYISTDKKVYGLFDYGTIIVVVFVLTAILVIEIRLFKKGIKLVANGLKDMKDKRQR